MILGITGCPGSGKSVLAAEIERDSFGHIAITVKVQPIVGHSGIIRPLYYGYKMTLAIFMALFRKLPKEDSP